nr:hypothetical protein [uncultured Halomonas sp.]
MKPFFFAALLVSLVAGDALAQADTPTHSCDKVLDIADTASQATPLALGADESLCLDSQQIATWFVDEDGWTSVLTSDKRFWQLAPPGPTRSIFTLHLPSGDQRKLRVVVNPIEAESPETKPETEPAATSADEETSQN